LCQASSDEEPVERPKGEEPVRKRPKGEEPVRAQPEDEVLRCISLTIVILYRPWIKVTLTLK